ncbi:hypothetical protein [Marinobacter psychrophilus]|jgi:hypothetical protein|uniref:hypothetical protein n=1 Tax=Marinobacter psychrophilus TaxID=330734 RepID=UPI001B703797|nr:hypothetical protein [Marinobacter psychrophilus]MBQ0761403.1 hypothetical protein [Marinobacter psychrophilus]MBQ0843411.1 hypothetical protein [Marinobacter psychrophilus]
MDFGGDVLYSFEFAKRLTEAAESLSQNSAELDEAGRTILYLSCLSCEISLKALLERSGYSSKELKKLSHNFSALLAEVSSCSVASTNQRGSSIRSKVVVPGTANGTIGTLLESEISGGSVYANEIRYGDIVRHYPPGAMLDCAKAVSDWCIQHDGRLFRAQAY